jgi:glycosyltransferase involved in cell wall biosynthesis
VTVAQFGGGHETERTLFWRRTQEENENNRFDQPFYVKLISNSSRLAGRTRFQEANLRLQAKQLGLTDKVVFAGRVPHREVHHYYDLINVLAGV